MIFSFPQDNITKRPLHKRLLTFIAAIGLVLASTTGYAANDSPEGNWRGPWQGTSSYAVNDIVTYFGATYINIAATAPVPKPVQTSSSTNLFDKNAVVNDVVIRSADGTIATIGGFQSTGFVSVAGATSFVTNITIGVFAEYGVAFYDQNRSWIAGSSLTGNGYYPAGAPVALPPSTSFVRFWWNNGNMGTTLDQAIVDAGTVLQTVYSPYNATDPTAPASPTPCAAPSDVTYWRLITNAAVSGPWTGKKVFVLGDSIVWLNPNVAQQIATRIGGTLSTQGATAPGVDAFPGRVFSNFQNGQGPNGYLPVSRQVIADVDLMLIALGTNQDSNQGLGSPTDAPNQYGTMSASMRYMLETIMAWKPGMRIVVAGPYQSGRYNTPSGIDGLTATWTGGTANAASIAVLQNINAAMKAVCILYSIPYIDMLNESGVNFSTSALWLTDGLHPNSLGYNTFYFPYIAGQLPRYTQQ